MFSSPAHRATPRKKIFRPRDSSAAPSTSAHSRGTPSIYSDRELREPITPSTRASRLGVPRPTSPVSSLGGETTRTGRTIGYAGDEGWEKVWWSRTDRRGVAAAGRLPREVTDVVKNCDLVTNPLRGHIDTRSGFAFVATPNLCLCWNYAKRTHSSPTVFMFPAPSSSQASSSAAPPVLAAFHISSSTEPGLVLVSPSGEVRFWENLSLALSNAERYQSLQLDLGQDDATESIWTVGNSLLITSSNSAAFRLNFTLHSGRTVISQVPLTRPGGMFGRASSAIFSSREDREGVRAVAVQGSIVWIMAGRIAQKWMFGPDSQKYVQEVDLYELVGHELFAERWSREGSDLVLLDLSAAADRLVALVSYPQHVSSSSTYTTQTSFALVVLKHHPRNGGLIVEAAKPMKYSTPPDHRYLDVPRLILPAGSDTVLVRFACTVLLTSLDSIDDTEDTITLKDSARNAFLGTSTASMHKSKPEPSPVVLMPAFGGLLNVDLYSPSATKTGPRGESSTQELKSRIEQAVFYGDRSDNPLSFDISSSVDSAADVALAAEAISSEIMTCSSAHMPAIHELRAQLSDRVSRLKELITFIHRNGLSPRLPGSSRRVLCRDGEKAKAAVDLWDYQNRHMNSAGSSSPLSLLSDSIRSVMDQNPDWIHDEDQTRAFFRHHIEKLDQILYTVFDIYKASAPTGVGADPTPWVVEANRIFIIVVRAAARYREDEQRSYELDRVLPSGEFWTSDNRIIDALEHLYFTTEKLISDRTRDLGTAIDALPSATDPPELKAQRQTQHVLKNQLAELAAAVCANMEDKLRTTSRRYMSEGGDEQEGIVLKKRWDTLRPRVIRPLVNVDRVAHAFDLAEHHNDYETLVWLCHDPIAGKGASKLQAYIERFGEEFAFVLYQWYINEGHEHALLSQDEVYGTFVTKFFEHTGYPNLSWLHHIACKRYGAAAEALSKVDTVVEELEEKHLVSSIGKLAAVAELKSRGMSEQRKQLLIEFDEQLDGIRVQAALRSKILSSAERRSAQSPASAYFAKHSRLLTSRPAFLALLSEITQKLAEGMALDMEDLVDMMTLKDNKGDDGRDAAIALERLSRETRLPDGRIQVALLSIWRRVFIRDDWTELSNTSGKSEEAVRAALRGTLAYSTIKAVGELTSLPLNLILAPYTCTQPPLLAELSARFPSKTPEAINALMTDHETEIATLERYIDQSNLESRIKEVAELVQRDAAASSAEGVNDAGPLADSHDIEM